NKLIETQDEVKIVSKGIISKTLIKLGMKYPKEIIPKLIFSLNSKNSDVLLNITTTLDGLYEKFPQKIDLEQIISILNQPIKINIKKEVVQLISRASKTAPQMIKPFISEIISSLPHQDSTIINILLRSLLELVKNEPGLIPARKIIALFDNKEPLIQESLVKLLGYTGTEDSNFTVDFLVNNTLKNDDWIVRNAAILSIGNILKNVINQDLVVERLISLLDDNNNWVQKSTMDLLSKLHNIKPSQIPLEKITNNMKSKDAKIREGCAQLLKIHVEEDLENTLDNFIILFGDQSKEVRYTAIDIVVKIIKKIGISKMFSKLLKNLSDEVPIETQQSIAIILGRTLRYGEESAKKRAISLLKIRCEVSQDPIICENLTKLKES
ncbi:MAG: HEAT repeat domain-containing protein, partial [Candidatus Thorarchaeota archaeon]